MIEIEGKEYKLEQIQTAIAMCVVNRNNNERVLLPADNDIHSELWFDAMVSKFFIKKYTVIGQTEQSDAIECGSEMVNHVTYENVVVSQITILTQSVLDELYEAYVPINWTL